MTTPVEVVFYGMTLIRNWFPIFTIYRVLKSIMKKNHSLMTTKRLDSDRFDLYLNVTLISPVTQFRLKTVSSTPTLLVLGDRTLYTG